MILCKPHALLSCRQGWPGCKLPAASVASCHQAICSLQAPNILPHDLLTHSSLQVAAGDDLRTQQWPCSCPHFIIELCHMTHMRSCRSLKPCSLLALVTLSLSWCVTCACPLQVAAGHTLSAQLRRTALQLPRFLSMAPARHRFGPVMMGAAYFESRAAVEARVSGSAHLRQLDTELRKVRWADKNAARHTWCFMIRSKPKYEAEIVAWACAFQSQ